MGMRLLEMSFTGAVLILVILIVRAVLVNRLPKRTFLVLWTLAILRLLLPFSISSAFSVYTLAKRHLPSGGDSGVLAETAGGLVQQIQKIPGNLPHVPTAAAGSEQLAETGSVWLFLWALGAGMLALFFLLSYIRCYREFRMTLPVDNEYVRKWIGRKTRKKPDKGLFGRSISVRQSDRIAAPLTYGIFRPVILLPKKMEWENQRQLQYVLLHEYTHICRWDAVWKIVCVTVVCVHWFNPMAWALYFFYNRDIELACDECVLRRLGEKRRADYARTLIGMEEERCALVPVYSGFGKNAIQERIRAIMKIRKVSVGISLFCVVLIAVVALVFATSSGGETEEQGKAAEESSVAAEAPAVTEVPEAPEKASEPEQPEEESPEADYSLTFIVEGTEEVVPAELFTGSGYAILIPKEGWRMNAPDSWQSEYNDKVQLWVVHYEGKDPQQVREELLAEGYAEGENMWNLQKSADGRRMVQTLTEDGTDVWGVIYTYPDEPELAEGFGARLPVIAASFQRLMDEEPSGEAAGGELSADAQEVQEVLTAFADAYFRGDEQGVRKYLTDPYEWDIEVRQSTEEVSGVRIKGLERLGEAEEGDTFTDSVEYLDSPQSDSFCYLAVELVKESGGWKISFYGVEM